MIINPISKGGKGLLPEIIVTAPSGSTLDLIQNSVVLQTYTLSSTETQHTFTVKNTGTYTVRGTSGSNTKSVEVVVDVVGRYDINVSYSRLPSDYQEVEYIQNPSGAYIQTSIKPDTSDFELSVRFIPFISSSNFTVIGIQESHATDPNFGVYRKDNNNFINVQYGGSEGRGIGVPLNLNSEYEIVFTGKNNTIGAKVYINNEQESSNINTTLSRTWSYPLAMFKWTVNGSGTYFSDPVRICEVTCRKGDTSWHFIPCYRKSDGVPGFYDLVNGTFYINSGSGTFEYGNAV